MCNFGSRPYGEYLSEIVLNLDQLLFKEASIFSFGDYLIQPRGTVYAIFYHVKVFFFLLLTLGATLFRELESFMQIW